MGVKLTSNLGRIARDLRVSAPDRVERVAEDIADRASAASGSRQVQMSMKVVQTGPVEFAVVSQRPWRYLEYGTVHMGARPFIAPAVQGAETRLGRALGDLLR